MIGLALALAVTCARCHPAEAAQAGTAMAHALESVADCAILKAHPQLGFRDGKYSYTIRREGEASIYSVTDGSGTVSALIAWVFGNGAAGQTYVFAQGGALYESRVSFYNALGRLDLTMGAASLAPASLQEAAGRKMDAANARECFSCHATGAVKGNTLALDALSPGVNCERCHGSTGQHLAALAPMPKLSTLTTEEVSNLCGRCHRTWEDIAANGPRGLVNVRFQPYRLTNSRCYDAADRRIACTACHNPHQPVVRQAAYYDAKCQACHAAGSCKVAARNCVACHMPKVELPGAHFAFTDHRIRIARPGDPYPN